jgi:hypothetical protein
VLGLRKLLQGVAQSGDNPAMKLEAKTAYAPRVQKVLDELGKNGAVDDLKAKKGELHDNVDGFDKAVRKQEEKVFRTINAQERYVYFLVNLIGEIEDEE